MTYVAFKWSFFGVDHHVPLQFTGNVEPFVAYFRLECFIQMATLVVLQTIRLSETFVADITLIKFLIRVDQRVFLQTT